MTPKGRDSPAFVSVLASNAPIQQANSNGSWVTAPSSETQVCKVPREAAGGVLVDTLLGQQAELTRRVREAIQAQILVYRSMAGEALDIEVGLKIGPLLQSVDGEQALTDREHAEFAAVA